MEDTGDVPRPAFVEKATPKDAINNQPIKRVYLKIRSIHLFVSFVCFICLFLCLFFHFLLFIVD